MLHSMMRAVIPLMTDARREMEIRPRDAVSDPFTAYLERHLLEEKGHDTWVLEDLEELGIHREIVLRRMPSPTVAGLVGAQYYWIRHYDPIALLGYFAVLEGDPPTVERVDNLVKRTGIPWAASRTIRRHAVDDVDHARELYRLLDQLPLSEEQVSLICVNASMTVVALVRCVEELLEDYESMAHAFKFPEEVTG